MQKRIETLMKLVLKKADAALISSDTNRLYLTNFSSSDGLILVLKNQSYLLLDFRYYESAKKAVNNMEIVLVDSFSKTLQDLIKKHNIKNILLENAHLTLEKADNLESIFNKVGANAIKNKALDEIIFSMRIIKTRNELSKIKTAQQITEKTFNYILPKIKKGAVERDLALDLEFYMRRLGAEKVAFDLIVISGNKTSMPHGEPGKKTIENGDFITMDIGATFEGYKSDMTRTVALGFVNEKQREVYDLVLKAQKEALQSVKAGIYSSDIDKKARNVIDSSVYNGTFRHALGHGVGLDIHEKPTIAAASNIVLEPGMVITIEPGIYLQNEFGVRIEDMVVVTETGYENLTGITKELIIL